MIRTMVIALTAVAFSMVGSPALAEKKPSVQKNPTPIQRCTNSYSLCVRDCYSVKGTGENTEATSCTQTCSTLYDRCKKDSSAARVKPSESAKTIAPTR